MAKVITFSRTFPTYHPKKGKGTNFIEKFLTSIGLENLTKKQFEDCETLICGEAKGVLPEMIELYTPKHHTIRAGNRFKAGDYFSPRVWSGKPYNSKQIILAPDTEIKKVWNFKINRGGFYINDRLYDGEMEGHFELLEEIAKNDGLNRHDLIAWFKYPKSFDGQIICWNKNVNY